ncbi:MAG: ribosomal protein L7/L12 [Myxococcaceae bacterium]
MSATSDQLAARAYELFLQRGGEHGHHDEDWAQAERELGGVSVVLTDTGKNKIAVIKELRVITGLDLEEVRSLSESTPRELKHGATRTEAERIRQRLTAVGASVEIRS